MKQQHGLVLLEVVIFLILISLGYIGWMNVRKNISEYDYAMQVTRNLCFYKEKLGQYIKNNNNIISTSTKKLLFLTWVLAIHQVIQLHILNITWNCMLMGKQDILFY